MREPRMSTKEETGQPHQEMNVHKRCSHNCEPESFEASQGPVQLWMTSDYHLRQHRVADEQTSSESPGTRNAREPIEELRDDCPAQGGTPSATAQSGVSRAQARCLKQDVRSGATSLPLQQTLEPKQKSLGEVRRRERACPPDPEEPIKYPSGAQHPLPLILLRSPGHHQTPD